MAGIGFTLDRIARENGLGGIASAACHGAVISSGPWLMTACGVLLLGRWMRTVMPWEDQMIVQTSLVYCFSISTVLTAPLVMIATRRASDSFYGGDDAVVPAILAAALAWATVLSLIIGTLLFGYAAALPPSALLFAVAMLTLFSQIWIATPFLHAARRHRPIFAAYLAGMAVTVVLLFLAAPSSPTGVLAAITSGLLIVVTLLIAAVREDFPAVPIRQADWMGRGRTAAGLAIAGLCNAMAVWADKWIIWWAPGSVQLVGALRVNPVNDQASFLGLLTMIPGLTLILIATETRFDRRFAELMANCTGTANRRRIERTRRNLARVIEKDLRLMVAQQAIIAAFCWVLAPEIMRVLDMNARGIFAFRLTVVGVIFHLIAIQMSIVLSYYDLFGRIVLVWAAFLLVSIGGTLLYFQEGFAGFGFGYLVGAVAAASLSVALVIQATSNLTYLLFVSNNSAVVGHGRFWA